LKKKAIGFFSILLAAKKHKLNIKIVSSIKINAKPSIAKINLTFNQLFVNKLKKN
jgi:hypothetical protein